MTNNKCIALLMLCMSMAFITNAAPVSIEQAQQEASSFLLKKKIAGSNLQLATRGNKMMAAGNNEAAYYIFNVGKNQGFVIVAGDDRINPILGYSDEGYFDEAKAPANMKFWLNEYAQQISLLDKVSNINGAIAAPKLANVVDTRNSIAPMITTKWDQATPYWNECPQFMNSDNEEDGYELAYTGCVATSMSQLMNYYKYPTQTTQVIPSYTFTYSDGNYNYSTVQMEELPITTFDWAHMKDSYTGAEDEIYTSAVAHLMYYVGCAVKSQYGISSTGAYTDDIPNGFALFGYGSKLAYRNDYTQDVWDEMVYQELAAGRPMIYNGTAGSGGGHSFICDGYEYGNYFHINWGWSGMGNGYFQLAVLNPYASGIGGSSSAEGYNMKQNIVYNVIPDGSTPSGDEDEEDPVLTTTAISGPSGWDRDGQSYPFKIYKSKIVKVSYSDHSSSGKKFKTALALYDPSTDSFEICENSESNGYFTVTTSALGQTTSFGSGIASNASNVIKFGAGKTGTYHLVGAYQLEGTSEWKIMKESDRYYLEVNLTSYSATASAHPVINLQTTNWEFTGGERVGVKEQINVTVKNNSVDRFFGDLYLDFGGQQIDEYSQYTTVVTGEVLPGEENVITFNVTPTSSGTKSVKLMRLDQYGSFVTIGTASVSIDQSAEAEELDLSVVITAENATTQPTASNIFGEIYDSHVRFSATITNNSNGGYSKYVLAPLFIVTKNEDGTVAGGKMVTYKQSSLSLAAGESKTLYFDFDNLAYGSTYAMNIYARNNVPDSEDASHVDNIVKPGESKYYDILPGIITWNANGERNGYKPVEGFQIAADVAAVSLESLTLSNILPNSNPNTLYFIDEGTSAPASLNGCNIVAGSTASSITLKDGYPYFTPQSFTAQSISYERTFDKARQDGVAENWSTIVLPFTPAACSASNGLWIERFAQEEDGEVKFAEVQNIEANVPYIISIDKASNLINTPITWSATNALLKAEPIAYTSGEKYLMAGTFVQQSLEDIYAVNNAGSIAQWASSNQSVAPFHAYFKEIEALSSHTDIPLPGEAMASDIDEVTLAELVANGEEGHEYRITNALTIAYISNDGKTLYAKDDNEFALQGQVPYSPTSEQIADDLLFDEVSMFDQSNWIAINLPEAVDDPDYYVNYYITDIEGTLNNSLNPEITLKNMPQFQSGANFTPNLMCIANFADENNYFLVPPKPMEYVKIHWAVYENGKFYMPKSENGVNTEHLNGVVNINNSICGDYNFTNNIVYEFTAIVCALKPRTTTMMMLPTYVNVQSGNPSSYYEVMPISIKDIPTAIGNINTDCSYDGIFYNLTGQPVTNPTPGIYIRDGRKVIVK